MAASFLPPKQIAPVTRQSESIESCKRNDMRINRIFLSGLFAVFFFTACETDAGVPKSWKKQNQKLLVEEAVDVNSYMSQAGNMRAHLTAPLMYNHHSDTPFIEFPKGIHVDLYKDTTLVRETIIDAKFCRYLVNDSKILLQDSVVVHNLLTGDSLKTNEMWWDQRQQIFYGNKPVVTYFTGMKQNLSGTGFHAKQDLSKWSLLDSTTGNMLVPPGMGTP